MTTAIFYQEQAARATAEAAAAVLANVRDRSQAAASAWTALAVREQLVDRARARHRAERAVAAALAEPSENPDRGDAGFSKDEL
jgi:hypothetical protein